MNKFRYLNRLVINKLKLLALLPLFLLASCKIDDFFKSPFAVTFPHDQGSYIGEQISDFIITYDIPVTTADVYLNSTNISKEFNYGENSATASIGKIRKYLREGENTLVVDPLAFGPTIKFFADTKGPTIIIKNASSKANPATSVVDISGVVNDSSDISSLVMHTWEIIDINERTGNVVRNSKDSTPIRVNLDKSFILEDTDIQGVDIFTFEATDIHGHTTTKEYLANNAASSSIRIPNAIRMAVGDTLVASLTPFIGSALYQGLEKAPIDVRDYCWNDPNKTGAASGSPNGGFCAAEQDGSTFPPGLNPVRMSLPIIGNANAIVQRLNMVSGSTVIMNGFRIEDNDRIYIDMDITHLVVGIEIQAGGILGNLPMTMSIDAIGVDTGARVSVVNKKMEVVLVDSNFALKGVNLSSIKIWGMEIAGLANIFIPLLEGLIGDLLPDILNPILADNLQKLVIGGVMYDLDENNEADLTKPFFEWAVNPETIKTDSTLGGAYEMIIGLETYAKVLTVDENNTNIALGSIYVEDPVDSSLVYNAQAEGKANISFALSSNALNQAFVALYNTGLTHLTLYNNKVSYGADPSLPAGNNKDTRVRLYPESPPFFTLTSLDGQQGGAAAASVGYESAVLYLDRHNGTEWENLLTLGVDLSIAASIDQEDNIVKLGIHEAPVLNINSMINNTGLPFVSNPLLQGVVDAVFVYFIPTINQEVFRLNMSDVADLMNGTRVFYRYKDGSEDLSGQFVKRSRKYSFNTPCDGASDCTPNGENNCTQVGGCKHVCDTLGIGGDNPGESLVCQTINFEMSTNTVGSIGSKGSNLFFQMQANEKGFVVPPGMPRFDMDNDGVRDFRDNCSVPRAMLEAAVVLEGGLKVGIEGEAGKNIDKDGKPINNFENRLKNHINKWVAYELIGSASGVTPGNYVLDTNQTGAVAPTGSAIHPVNYTAAYRSKGNRTLVQWWDYMRKTDDPVAAQLANDDYPWITLRYSNASRYDSDGDGIGELCEDDDDRDGIYTDNGTPYDTCALVYDESNNPGKCTIDALDEEGLPVFVLFKNKFKTEREGKPMCLSHRGFAGVPDNIIRGTFSPSSNNPNGSSLDWAECNTNDRNQHFYVQVAANTSPRENVNGVMGKERVLYIYTNGGLQAEPGFYDQENYHFLAATIANQSPPNSDYWSNDDVIVTGMLGYANSQQGNWRQWILSLSYDVDNPTQQTIFGNYPYIIESARVWDVYGNNGRRDCIFSKVGLGGTTHDLPDADEGSCYPNDDTNRARAAFDVLLGEDMAPWRGKFMGD